MSLVQMTFFLVVGWMIGSYVERKKHKELFRIWFINFVKDMSLEEFSNMSEKREWGIPSSDIEKVKGGVR